MPGRGGGGGGGGGEGGGRGMLYRDTVSLTPSIQVFRVRPLALRPLNLVLYARWAGWCGGSRVRCPNHLVL